MITKLGNLRKKKSQNYEKPTKDTQGYQLLLKSLLFLQFLYVLKPVDQY